MTYPVFLNLKDSKVIIVGGGRIAERKLKGILHASANVFITAPEISEAIERIACNESKIFISRNAFDLNFLNDATLVFAATDDPAMNDTITDYCKQKGILINNCMDASKSTFTSGAVIREGDVEILIGTGGKRPGVSKYLREQIQRILPQDLSKMIKHYDSLRLEARKTFNKSKDRETYIKEKFKAYTDSVKGNDHEN